MSRSTIVATFKSADSARRAIKEIGEEGLANNQISFLLVHDEQNSTNPGAPLPDFNGILVQAGPFNVDGIGEIVAAGPLAGALRQGDKSLITALSYYGIDDDHGAYYQSLIKTGHGLVVIETNNEHLNQTANILEGYGGKDVTKWHN